MFIILCEKCPTEVLVTRICRGVRYEYYSICIVYTGNSMNTLILWMKNEILVLGEAEHYQALACHKFQDKSENLLTDNPSCWSFSLTWNNGWTKNVQKKLWKLTCSLYFVKNVPLRSLWQEYAGGMVTVWIHFIQENLGSLPTGCVPDTGSREAIQL